MDPREMEDGLHMLHFYMLEHMKRMSMNESAEVFAKEAGFSNASTERNQEDNGFLSDWWCVFWDVYKSRGYDRSSGHDGEEAYAQAQAQANNGTANPQPHIFTEIVSRMQQPATDIQPLVVPGFVNANVQQGGWALPVSPSSSNPRSDTAQAPQQPSHGVWINKKNCKGR